MAKNGLKRGIVKNKYSFEMLNTDDSTDEETTSSIKRGNPPTWCLRKSLKTTNDKFPPIFLSSIHCAYTAENRKYPIAMQTHLNTLFVDAFFSVQKMSPDLRAIFPNIEPKFLKRNSSAVWNTPPRYSQLPKY